MKKLFALLTVLLIVLALVGCEDFDPAHPPFGEPSNTYLQSQIDDLQSQIDELELIIDNLEEIIVENQRRLDEELDIEIMYGEISGVEASMDGDPNNDYVLVTVNGVEYKTFHISDETIYWGSDMVVIKIGDIYLSYVDEVKQDG